MPVRTVCRSCQTNYQFPDELLGRSVRCKNCQAVFTAEPADAVQAAPRPAAPLPAGSLPAPAPRAGGGGNALPIILAVLGISGLAMVLLCAGLAAFGFYRFRQAVNEAELAEFQQFEEFAELKSPAPIGMQPARINPLDYINRVHVQFSDQQRFGLVCPRLRSPADPAEPKRLTRDPRGITSNTMVRIKTFDYIWGAEIPGVRYVRDKGKVVKEAPIPGKDKDRAWQTWWEDERTRVRVAQSVEIIVGGQTRLYDTALIKYHVWNRDRTPHEVGLRVMLDTHIGGTDGVPFLVPPTAAAPARLEEHLAAFTQANVPSFVQALESNNLGDQNAVLAVVGLKVKGSEPLEKVVVCRWPQNSEARWGGSNGPGDWPYEAMDKNPNARDSAVILYWVHANMKPDEHRDLSFTYGLGRVLSDEPDRQAVAAAETLRLTVDPGAALPRPFAVIAYVKAAPDAAVTLKLPPGLTLVDGNTLTQKAPAPGREGYAVVGWRVQAAKPGRYVLEAQGAGGTARETVQVDAGSLLD